MLKPKAEGRVSDTNALFKIGILCLSWIILLFKKHGIAIWVVSVTEYFGVSTSQGLAPVLALMAHLREAGGTLGRGREDVRKPTYWVCHLESVFSSARASVFLVVKGGC